MSSAKFIVEKKNYYDMIIIEQKKICSMRKQLNLRTGGLVDLDFNVFSSALY